MKIPQIPDWRSKYRPKKRAAKKPVAHALIQNLLNNIKRKEQ